MPEGKYDQQVLQAAREQFSDFGFFGARIDTIATTARVNKRMVYEFCHTKDGLYMIALSDVSREAMDKFNEIIPALQAAPDVCHAYAQLLEMFDKLDNFVRLWAWECMYMTIHGPRILETANAIFERMREILQIRFPDQNIQTSTFETIEKLCHGYLLTTAMYARSEEEQGGENEQATQDSDHDLHRIEVALHMRKIAIDSIARLLGGSLH